jgi:predicted ArsR family transcriptional regulator
VYCLTEQGDALYPKLYDSLASVLLNELRGIAGPDALQRVLRRVASRFAEPYTERVEGKPLAARVDETARIIEERGCLADCTLRDGDWHLSQYTCPFPSVARSNSGVCAMEVDFVRRLTGADARLVSSLLRGDRSCTYRIRPASTGAS